MSVVDPTDAAAMVLITGFYLDPNAERQRELLECLTRNVDNAWIARMDVHVEYSADLCALGSAYPPLASPKVRLVAAGRRVTFRDLFDHANRELAGWRVIIANADIFFDHTLARLDGYDLSSRLLCLSRWDVGRDGTARLFDFAGSQDAWVFQAPIRDFPCAFPLGVPGCDNRLAWEASEAGLEVTNPSRSVRAHHLHLSGVRRYVPGRGVPGPTRTVAPGYLGSAQVADAAPPVRCAAVAFRESMGYTLRRFAAGASSHNNDPRPLREIPSALAGRQFTQVVSGRAAPVEVEFLSAGKLYVLVGTDWEGHEPASAWLRTAGQREPLPPVETLRGTAFEVWSLRGEAGDRFVIPTQVMLVSDHLERRAHAG
jgi:hypothetical protein